VITKELENVKAPRNGKSVERTKRAPEISDAGCATVNPDTDSPSEPVTEITR
jgi:hypothetical protein